MASRGKSTSPARGRTQAVTLAYVGSNMVTTSWHLSVMQLREYDRVNSRRLDRGGFIAMRCGTDGLVEARNQAVAAFLAEDKADWLFWVDTDMGFAPDTVDRLFEAADRGERPMVGALCFAQIETGPDGLGGYLCQATPTVYDWTHVDGKYGWQVRWDYPANTLTRVAGTGSACVLIHRNVFEKVAAEHGPTWYGRVPNPTTGQLVSEDLSFCLRAGALNIPIHVHTGVPTNHMKTMWVGEHEFYRQRAAELAVREARADAAS